MQLETRALRLLRGHPVQIGDLIQITGALPTGQIKAHCLIWDVAYDLVVFDIKKELRAWNGHVYLSVLNELHGSTANLDVQTASNLDLAGAAGRVHTGQCLRHPRCPIRGCTFLRSLLNR